MNNTTDQSRTAENGAPYPWLLRQRGNFNEFLAKAAAEDEPQIDIPFAKWLLVALQQEGVVIWLAEELCQFRDRHRHWFRPLTPEEIARGVESLRSLWEKYGRWSRNWDHELQQVKPPIELRSLADQIRNAQRRRRYND